MLYLPRSNTEPWSLVDGRSGRGREGVCAAAGCTLKTEEFAANEVQRVGSMTCFWPVLINASREAGGLVGKGGPRCPLQK